MNRQTPYTRVILIAVGAILACALIQDLGERSDVVAAGLQQGQGIPDTGLLMIETNQKLDQANKNLAELNKKMDKLIGMLESGKIKVVVMQEQVKVDVVEPAGKGR